MSIMVNGIEVMMSQQDLDALLAPVDATLLAGSTILEYGSGGSTSIFADKLGFTHNLFSVEHHKEWFEKVGKRLEGHPNEERIARVLAGLSFHIGIYKFARPEEEMGAGAREYIWAPENAVEWCKVGLVLVDGISRGPCLAYLRTRLNPGTPVFLHDYVGRETWYDWACDLYDRVQVHDLMLEMRVPLEKETLISVPLDLSDLTK
jgi:hypothetical protein